MILELVDQILDDLDREIVLLGERFEGACHSAASCIEHSRVPGSLSTDIRHAAAGPPGEPRQGWIVGTEALYRWADRNPSLLMRPVSYTHNPRVLSSFDNFFAINAAIDNLLKTGAD